jgi:hypothetical protein
MAGSDMKVSGAGPVGSTGAARASRPASGGGAAFAPIGVGGASDVARPAASAGVSTVASLEALMALQEVGGPLERRRRAAARGGRLLDALEQLKIGMLEGALPRAAVEALARDAREQRQATDDPGLDGVLAEIEMRAAVELAKLEQARVAA